MLQGTRGLAAKKARDASALAGETPAATSVTEDAVEAARAGGVGINEGNGVAGARDSAGERQPLRVGQGVFVLKRVVTASRTSRGDHDVRPRYAHPIDQRWCDARCAA